MNLNSKDVELLKRANADALKLVERLKQEFYAKVVDGDGFIEVVSYGLLLKRVHFDERRIDKRTRSTDTRFSTDVLIERTERRTTEWVRVRPQLRRILLADIAAESELAQPLEERTPPPHALRHLIQSAKAKLTPSELDALRIYLERK